MYFQIHVALYRKNKNLKDTEKGSFLGTKKKKKENQCHHFGGLRFTKLYYLGMGHFFVQTQLIPQAASPFFSLISAFDTLAYHSFVKNT